MKTKYHIVVTTTDEEAKEELVKHLYEKANDFEFEVECHEHEADPGEEEGEYIVWYHSPSHKKDRYYVGPPTIESGGKPVWSYKKKDAARLSKNACQIVAARVAMIGYKTPLQLAKASAKLGVIKGGKTEGSTVVEGPFKKTAIDMATGLVGIGVDPEGMKNALDNAAEGKLADGTPIEEDDDE